MTGQGERSLRAWAASPLAGLPVSVRDALLASSVTVRVPGGQGIGEADAGPTFAMVHKGHLRVQLVTPAGRTATIRYASESQVLGLPSAIAGTTPWTAYAITDCELTMMSSALLRELASADAGVAWHLAGLLAEISYEVIDVLGGHIFEPVLQRVCRHLLELAERTDTGLVVVTDQHELAQSIVGARGHHPRLSDPARAGTDRADERRVAAARSGSPPRTGRRPA